MALMALIKLVALHGAFVQAPVPEVTPKQVPAKKATISTPIVNRMIFKRLNVRPSNSGEENGTNPIPVLSYKPKFDNRGNRKFQIFSKKNLNAPLS
jgi:hypothetical protein